MGEGVLFATSISITFSWSLRGDWISPCHGRQHRKRDNNIPISEPAHALCQIASSLEFGVYDCVDINLWKAMADEGAKVLWEAPKGIVTSLLHPC